ncbi:MAG: hypothetical protein ILO43_04200 [Clostridia bacterium]|nr:hypothetical protein [Clostridia bacterium]
MNQENKDYNEDRVLIEESDAGRRRREAAALEPKKSKVRPWLIATAAVVLVGIIAGLSVYFVQKHQRENAVYERTISAVTTEPAATTEEDFEIEDSDDIVITGEDAIGGEMGIADDAASDTETTSDLDEEEDGEDEEDTTKRTTRRTTRRTTAWNAQDAQRAIEDFWRDVSRAVS